MTNWVSTQNFLNNSILESFSWVRDEMIAYLLHQDFRIFYNIPICSQSSIVVVVHV